MGFSVVARQGCYLWRIKRKLEQMKGHQVTSLISKDKNELLEAPEIEVINYYVVCIIFYPFFKKILPLWLSLRGPSATLSAPEGAYDYLAQASTPASLSEGQI